MSENEAAAGSQAFHGFPIEPVSTSNAGGKCVTAGETATLEMKQRNIENMLRAGLKDPRLDFMPTQATHTINTAKTVAVATDTFWIPIDKDTPRAVKLQLLGKGGVAHYGSYNGDDFWTHWCPLPKKRKEE